MAENDPGELEHEKQTKMRGDDIRKKDIGANKGEPKDPSGKESGADKGSSKDK